MTRQTYFIVYAILFFSLLLSPFWLWFIKPSKELNVLILDKTVPNQTYREHKGLTWILNNEKYTHSISMLQKDLNKYNVFYLPNQIDVSGINQIEQVLLSAKGKTFIAEFDSFSSITPVEVREKISNLLNLDWTGWIGRYFTDLNSTEVPEWVKEKYEENKKKWNFTGEGFVFVNTGNDIVVVDDKDISDMGALFKLSQKGKKHFGREFQGNYQYWFDINNARNKEEILAEYQLPFSPKKKEELRGLGIPSKFPAIIYHQNAKYNSYYFAGDYADEAAVPEIYQTKGLDIWKEHFGMRKSFYWKVYVPMMKMLLSSGLSHTVQQQQVEVVKANGINTNSKTGESYIQIQTSGKWNDFLIKGVNMGIGKPGYFPGETAITKEEYARWFKAIGEMNANAIRVYTLHPPQFYEAFYEYNQIAKKPLFLFHGTWVNEEKLAHNQDAFAAENIEDAKTEIKNMIDIIHGNANLSKRSGHASGVYPYDISKYVLGFIIGTEWDPIMVVNTNLKHSGKGEFAGKYFTTTDANAFEVWLANLMDYAADYESSRYNWQHTMSFTNWVTTDLIKHPSEPLKNEDMVSVNPNHISTNGEFQAGLFASYHIYPYYPDFLNYEKKYLDYVDASEKKNNYAGYLNELIAVHNMPVLVAEFGVPSSRGLTHKNAFGMNQGFHSEEEQGLINQQLFQSIVSEGYAGGLIFSWQDEWFKRTWNTQDLDNPDRRPYWNNQQTNEQHFGLLSFDPGEVDQAIFVDGEKVDWNQTNSKTLYQSEENNEALKEVKISSDSGYLYFLLSFNQKVDFKKQSVYLLLDTIGEQGQNKISLSNGAQIETDFGIDFLLNLTGKGTTRIMVDSYYDSFYFQYAHLLKMVKTEADVNRKNNGVFHPIRLVLNKELKIPSSNTTIPFESYETGILKHGTANPGHKDFNSLTDFSISKDYRTIEIRIPWQLINIKDPSLKEAMGDMWKNGLSSSVPIEGIRVAVTTTEQGKIKQTIPKLINNRLQQKDVFLYTWNEWEQPTYYERLKKSFDILKETYGTIKSK